MTPDRIIERERNWALPAAIAAMLPLLIVLGANILTASLTSGDTGAEQQREFHSNASALLAATVLEAVGIALLVIPLLYLFRAAEARNPRVQRAFIGFVFLGPLLFGLQFVLGWAAADEVSKDYIDRAPQVQHVAYADFERQLERQPGRIEKVNIYPDADVAEVEYSDGTFADVAYPKDQESRLTDQLDRQEVDNETDSSGDPGDALISSLADDSSVRNTGLTVFFVAALAMVVAMVYTGLQATRVGLLTRFFGTLGMALGASLILLAGVALIVILVWFAYLGLVYLGRVPGGRPPAWETGEAIPWPRPGEEPPAPAESGGTIEGSATEVSSGSQAGAADAGSSGQPRKRKRRR